MILACVAEITVGKANIGIYMKPVVVLNRNPATQTGATSSLWRPSQWMGKPLLAKSHLTRRLFGSMLRRMKALPRQRRMRGALRWKRMQKNSARRQMVVVAKVNDGILVRR